MKHLKRTLSLLLFAAFIMTAAVIPAFATNSESVTDAELTVGESDTPGPAALLIRDGGTATSSDESVVTVNSSGKVTAVGEGTAYVHFSNNGLSLTYRYTVTAAEDPTEKPTEALKEDEDNRWEPNKEFMEDFIENNSSDPEMPEVDLDFFYIFPLIIMVLGTVLAIFLLGFIAIPTIALSISSMGKKDLPQHAVTDQTVRTPVPDYVRCPKCGRSFDDGDFCSNCGTGKKVRNVYQVPINGRMGSLAFEKHINKWLAENPYIYDCKLSLEAHQSLSNPFVYGKRGYISRASVSFSVADRPQQKQYGFAYLYRWRLLGPLGYDGNAHVNKWLKKNPDCTVISQQVGRIQHLGNQTGISTEYFGYVFFQK